VKRNILPLWDFGWFDRDSIQFSGVGTPEEALSAYFRSTEFGVSFISPERVECTDIHGPFRREMLSESDFVLITTTQFMEKIGQIRQPEGFTEQVSDSQWSAIEAIIFDLCKKSVSIYALRFTEKDCERHHELGFILFLFREFICVQPDFSIVRIVFGYD
jgi:hypothetical protein